MFAHGTTDIRTIGDSQGHINDDHIRRGFLNYRKRLFHCVHCQLPAIQIGYQDPRIRLVVGSSHMVKMVNSDILAILTL